MGEGSLSYVDGHLLVLSRSGELTLLKADRRRYQPVAGAVTSAVKGDCYAAPSFADGVVYVRSITPDPLRGRYHPTAVLAALPEGQRREGLERQRALAAMGFWTGTDWTLLRHLSD